MTEVVPGIARLAVVLAHRAPLTLAQVRSPHLPGCLTLSRLLQSDVLSSHAVASLGHSPRSSHDSGDGHARHRERYRTRSCHTPSAWLYSALLGSAGPRRSTLGAAAHRGPAYNVPCASTPIEWMARGASSMTAARSWTRLPCASSSSRCSALPRDDGLPCARGSETGSKPPILRS